MHKAFDLVPKQSSVTDKTGCWEAGNDAVHYTSHESFLPQPSYESQSGENYDFCDVSPVFISSVVQRNELYLKEQFTE